MNTGPLDVVQSKVCTGCFLRKEASQFTREKRRRSGLGSLCKLCQHEVDAKKRAAHPEQYRVYERRNRAKEKSQERARHRYVNGGKFRLLEKQLIKRYGIDFHDWALMFESQWGRCGICCNRLKFDHSTHVDHDHTTGRVRGLLCHHCNVLIGHIRGSPARIFKQLTTYLGDS